METKRGLDHPAPSRPAPLSRSDLTVGAIVLAVLVLTLAAALLFG
jgi:hypothetical protein